MRAVKNLSLERLKLIVFGTPIEELENQIIKLSKTPSISYVGWLSTSQIYDYFIASDLAFFPGTHSVLWEQAVGTGLPCVFKDMEGFHHIDLGGNCLFIDQINIPQIQSCIKKLYRNKILLQKMKEVSSTKGIKKFSYFNIAKKAIEI